MIVERILFGVMVVLGFLSCLISAVLLRSRIVGRAETLIRRNVLWSVLLVMSVVMISGVVGSIILFGRV